MYLSHSELSSLYIPPHFWILAFGISWPHLAPAGPTRFWKNYCLRKFGSSAVLMLPIPSLGCGWCLCSLIQCQGILLASIADVFSRFRIQMQIAR